MNYNCFQEMYDKAEKSLYYKAGYDDESEVKNKALSERLLFTQSNLRVLAGQDTMGRLYFVSCPHKRDYALPTMRMDQDNYITACPGMFYQTNITLLLGKMTYSLTDSEGRCYQAANIHSTTEYLDYYLPCTRTDYEDISVQVVSIAPVLEEGAHAALAPLPLPGPSGCLYSMTVRNTGKKPFTGNVALSLHNCFMEPYELAGKAVEERTFEMEHVRTDKGLLMLYGEDGAAAVHMEGGHWDKNYVSVRSIEVDPGEEVTITARVAAAERKDEINEALCILYMHDALEWINITSNFWRSRIGRLQTEVDGCGEILEKQRDIVIRSVLDNFNCLQADREGRLCVHWQGAPSHNIGRFWGIDFEPTSISVMYFLPELGRMLLDYITARNEPRYSVYPDHSAPILCAPLIAARKYAEFTGDLKWFRQCPGLWERLVEIYRKLISFKAADSNLISSHFSSDGLVMNRYDNGTNVKIWYAIDGFAQLCALLEEDIAVEAAEFADKLKSDIQDLLEAEGPFGRQIKGGINGRKEDFYLNGDLYYYDGEDSASCMAPVYGIYGFDYEPWVNYHRFARSLFASNYNPEMGTLRWFPYGGANDGTAYVSQLGGSVTREEQRASLENLLNRSVDFTGSVYWWPLGENFVRRISRCSQGQGFLVWQYLQQWIGLQADMTSRRIRIAPGGLPRKISWENGRIGNFVFDFYYEENERGTHIRLLNKGAVEWTVETGLRKYDTGAGAVIWQESRCLKPYGSIEADFAALQAGAPDAAADIDIERTECEAFCQNTDHALDHIGYHMPLCETQESPVIVMQYVLYTKRVMEDVRITAEGPSGWRFREKAAGMWDDSQEVADTQLQTDLGTCQPWKRHVIPFWVKLNQDEEYREVWFQRHPLALWRQEDEDVLYVQSDRKKEEESLTVTLTWREGDERLEEKKEIPVRYCLKQERDILVKKILGGRNVCD
ncbi:hypothetical protein [Murimonas intestini]|uniref:Cellobiose phosphorylase n=1 Tax=Murimonas intestini TaxID=1337051 RepID=A0AB73T5J0_9FIRM|nr:hypothetical protein [Murimonas intestini]MCR1841916.1 hypothetical protein [Murimonas intestini]MCR1864986.1 hypothetical protein [Murimonas intestini]MCR1885683.1 hypothetical protein [Murimonas intestini]